MKKYFTSILIISLFGFIANFAFGATKLECMITYEGLRPSDEKLKYNGSVILNINEFPNYNSYEIDSMPVFMKIDNNKEMHQYNRSITFHDRSDTGKWDFSIKISYANGNTKTKDFMLDRNTGKLAWTEYTYTSYPSKVSIKSEIHGQCKKIDINNKLF